MNRANSDEKMQPSLENANAIEQRLSDLNVAILNCIKQWQAHAEKCNKLLEGLSNNRIRMMGVKERRKIGWKMARMSQIGSIAVVNMSENQLMAVSDEILRDSERLIAFLPKFTAILHRLRQFPSKLSALSGLISGNFLLQMQTNHLIEQLPNLIWMFEQDLAFRKNSLKDFALTDDRDLFTIINSAWKHGIYIEPGVISQFAHFSS